jgi:hypothetical protein
MGEGVTCQKQLEDLALVLEHLRLLRWPKIKRRKKK